MLQSVIERKISATIGREVTFEKLNVSLFSGSVEAVGMRIAGDEGEQPFLTIARIRAEVSIIRAMKGEIAINSLSIEKPILNFRRDRSGKTNLPRPGHAPVNPDAAKADDKPWKIEIEKALLVDGRINAQIDLAGNSIDLSLADLLADVKRSGDSYAITVLAKSMGRTDADAQLGELKGTAALTNLQNLSDITEAALQANAQFAGLRAQISAAKIGARTADASLQGNIDLKTIRALWPPSKQGPIIEATVALDIACHIDAGRGIQFSRMKVESSDASVNFTE